MTVDEIKRATAMDVMGWEDKGDCWGVPGFPLFAKKFWQPVSRWDDAGSIIMRMTKDSWSVEMHRTPKGMRCLMTKGRYRAQAIHHIALEAICVAAILAKMIERGTA